MGLFFLLRLINASDLGVVDLSALTEQGHLLARLYMRQHTTPRNLGYIDHRRITAKLSTSIRTLNRTNAVRYLHPQSEAKNGTRQ